MSLWQFTSMHMEPLSPKCALTRTGSATPASEKKPKEAGLEDEAKELNEKLKKAGLEDEAKALNEMLDKSDKGSLDKDLQDAVFKVLELATKLRANKDRTAEADKMKKLAVKAGDFFDPETLHEIVESSEADRFDPTNRQTKLTILPDPKHMQQQASVRVDDLQSYAAQKFKYHCQYQHWGMLWRHAVFTIVLCVYLTFPLHTHIAFDIENGLRDALVEV